MRSRGAALTRHQTGIVLVVGWALLLPPWGGDGFQAPMGRWQHAGSFHSAKECEAVRAELIDAARRPLGDPWMVPDLGDATQVEQKISWVDTRCVQRDDPRIGPRD
jgi:hypothetical protein